MRFADSQICFYLILLVRRVKRYVKHSTNAGNAMLSLAMCHFDFEQYHEAKAMYLEAFACFEANLGKIRKPCKIVRRKYMHRPVGNQFGY